MNRSERRANTETAISRQVRIARAYASFPTEPHQYAKRKWANCGSPRCQMCQNPRKRGELTLQELRLIQRQAD